MKSRTVKLLPEAESDLEDIFWRLADLAGESVARNYVNRLREYARKLDLASERGHRRDDIRPGIRVLGFERRVTIAFFVGEDDVVIARFFYGGRDWESELSGD